MEFLNWNKVTIEYGGEIMKCDIIGTYTGIDLKSEVVYLLAPREWMMNSAMILTKDEMDKKILSVIGSTNIMVRIFRTVTRF